MGGVIGHIQHPHENLNLTFEDLYDLITFITSGQYTDKDYVIHRLEATEKLDGQQLSVSWRDDKGLMVARNKGHLKNFGNLSMLYNDLQIKFKDHICGKAFCDAYDDLDVIISGLTDKQRNEIFNNGRKWVSLEVINPLTTNIIPYNQKIIIFHYSIEYDENGNFIKLYENDGQKLDDALFIQFGRKSNVGTYTFSSPQYIKTADISKWDMRFYNQLRKVMALYGLNINNTIGEYFERYFFNILKKNLNLTPISNDVINKILRRFVYGDKSFTLPKIKKVDADLAEWVKMYELEELKFEFKYARRSLEKCFLELGSLLLYHTLDVYFLAKGNLDSTTELLSRLDNTISKIGITNRKLNHQLYLLKEINNCVPGYAIATEGIVFHFKDELYKLTGRFAPINQILGEQRF